MSLSDLLGENFCKLGKTCNFKIWTQDEIWFKNLHTGCSRSHASATSSVRATTATSMSV